MESRQRRRFSARHKRRRPWSIGIAARAIAIISFSRPGVPCPVRAARLSKRAHPLARRAPAPPLAKVAANQAKRRTFQIVATTTVNIHVARTHWGLSKGANRFAPKWRESARIAVGPATPSAVLNDQHSIRLGRAATVQRRRRPGPSPRPPPLTKPRAKAAPDDHKRRKPTAKNRGNAYAAQTNHYDRRKDPPAAPLPRMRGNGDSRCLNNERGE